MIFYLLKDIYISIIQQLYDNLTKSSAELTALMKDMQDYPGRYFAVSVFGNSRADKQDKKREEAKKKK